MPSIIGLATNSVLTAVENKIPNVVLQSKKKQNKTKKKQIMTQKYETLKLNILLRLVTMSLLQGVLLIKSKIKI